MSDVVEQARKNEALYKSLAQDAARNRIHAGAEVNRFDKLNHSDAPREDRNEWSVMIGGSFSDGKWSFGLSAGPEDRRGAIYDRAVGFSNQCTIYTKLAELSGKGHIVSDDDFYTYQANHISDSKVKDFFSNLFGGRDSALKHLDKYEQFVKEGGKVDELVKVLELDGSEKEYMKQKKSGHLPEYMDKLQKEEKARELEEKREEAKNKKEEEEAAKAEREEARQESKEVAPKNKDKKISYNEEAVKDAMDGINKSGTQIALSNAVNIPNVTAQKAQHNQIV